MFVVGIIIFGGAFAYWLLYFRNNGQGLTGGSTEYDEASDPNAQAKYDTKNAKKEPRMTAKQLLDLSWKFLYDIAEIVMYKFSSRSRNEVHDCGKALAENGMRYNHEVAKSPKAYGISDAKTISDSKGKNSRKRG